MRSSLARAWAPLALLGALGAAPGALAQPTDQDRPLFRSIYQELVEIDTTDSAGDNTQAARAMAARLKAGGFADADMQILVPPGGPKKGNLVARMKGTGARKPLLLVAHLDVVEARREDWQRDPFKLVEENGYFFARGSVDDKSMAASFVTNLIRMKQEGYKPERDLILALTADEEPIPSKFNGVEFLLKNHPDLIDAELALNEGGGGALDKSGKPLMMGVQSGEKVSVSYQLEVTNPGGHSSLPLKDNAITHLADGLSRLGRFDFPFRLSDTTRTYFARTAAIQTGQAAADMRAVLHDPPDPEAVARLSASSPRNNAAVRTTCVATMVDAGHANNALPQRARAVVNCRILPGEPVEDVQKTLVRVLADDQIKVTQMGEAQLSPAPPLNPEVTRAIETISAQMWPGVPVIPFLLQAATDGRFLNNAGIWTYGVGPFFDPDGNGLHGLNERIRVKSLYDEHEFLYRLIKALAGGGVAQ